jgi:hypothetical protein
VSTRRRSAASALLRAQSEVEQGYCEYSQGVLRVLTGGTVSTHRGTVSTRRRSAASAALRAQSEVVAALPRVAESIRSLLAGAWVLWEYSRSTPAEYLSRVP